MSDESWEKFARSDPYWAVLTDPRFKGEVGQWEREEFFRSGAEHMRRVTTTLRHHFGRAIGAQDCCLDFGCGVGRLLIPMAQHCGRAIGIDVSATMRRICMENAAGARLDNVECHGDVNAAALADASFDWVNSYIVFQHIDPKIGFSILSDMLRKVAPGGVASLHFTVFKDRRVGHYLTDRFDYFTVGPEGVGRVYADGPYYGPDTMMMNDYDVTRLYMVFTQHGFRRVLTEHEDQEGMHGLHFFAVKDA